MTVKQPRGGARTMKISSKGQVTIPREVRRVLGSDVVAFDVENGRVLLRPVTDVGGSLREYAGHGPAGDKFRAAREHAWEEVAREKAGRSNP